MVGVIPETVVDYLQTLSRVMLGVEATDARGGTLPVEGAAGRAVAAMLAVRTGPGAVMIIGNGGSSAIASHMHNDLTKMAGVRTLVFNETALLTAFANDDGYETSFEKPLKMWAGPGSALLAISSSGRSPNILRAVEAARERGCAITTFSGFAPENPLRALGDVNFYVPSQVYGFVETAHAAIGHYLTDRAAALARG